MNEDRELSAVAAVFENECTRCILVQAYRQYLSVSELADRCGVSESTVYRRLEPLREQELIVERTRPDEDGHHFKEYQTKLEQLTVGVTEEGLEVTVQRRESLARRLTDIVERL